MCAHNPPSEPDSRDSRIRLSQEIMCKPWGSRDVRVNDRSGNEIKFTEPLSDHE
jgi:hypothetical protein